MNRNTYLIYLFITLLLCSCNNKTNNSNKEKHIIEFKQEYITNYNQSNIVDSTQLICLLENPDEDLQIKQIDKICIKNNHIYIADTYLKRLIVFNKEGIALHQIGSMGNGPGEYSSIADFYVTASNDIYIYDSVKKKIILYDSKNNYIKDFNIDFEGEHFVYLNNNEFLFSLAPYNEGKLKRKKIAITDKDFNIINTMFEFEKNTDPNYQFISPLTEYCDKFVYNRGISNDIYIFSSKGTIENIITFDFGSLNVSTNKLNDINKLLESDDSYSYIAACPILINNTILSIINKENELFTCIYDIKKKKTYLNNISNFSVNNLNIPLSVTDKGQVISYFNEDIYPNYKNDKNISESIKNEIQDGAYVVCLYNINNSFFN
ncbi:6-bladed beta-propeller [Parabacteroides gordonii]|uniref:6-bladed beta-propeller n=1 Tax=Parabacteroides gordonii TaxID=574930 RepID=UPI0026EEC1F5|nr:6-bladed beta-propeller [Parabacteroides gordonii]